MNKPIKRLVSTKVPPRHPAASSAESDLIKLTREFESLRKQLEDNKNTDDELMDLRVAEIAEHNTKMQALFDKSAHMNRQRRMLDAQFINVSELIRLLAGERSFGGIMAHLRKWEDSQA